MGAPRVHGPPASHPCGRHCFLSLYIVFLLWRKEWKKAALAVVLSAAWFAWEKIGVAPGSGVNKFLFCSRDGLRSRSRSCGGDCPVLRMYAHNIWSFAGSMYANILFPWLYDLAEMNKLKRLIVLSVFFEGCIGAFLLWKNRPGVRLVLIALAISLVPVFACREPGRCSAIFSRFSRSLSCF